MVVSSRDTPTVPREPLHTSARLRLGELEKNIELEPEENRKKQRQLDRRIDLPPAEAESTELIA